MCCLQVSSALAKLASELTLSVDQVNELAAASLGDPGTPMGSIVRVLNGQLQVSGHDRRVHVSYAHCWLLTTADMYNCLIFVSVFVCLTKHLNNYFCAS